MLNKCCFIGNLGKDPEARNTNSGSKIVSFTIACTSKWKAKDTGERKEKTDWIPIVIFDENIANIAESYLKKGSKVYVEGKFQTRKWTDQSGADRYSTEIVLDRFKGVLVLLDSKGDSDSAERPAFGRTPSKAAPSRSDDDFGDEVPF